MTETGRWDLLAADMAAQAEALELQDRAAEIAERARHEIGQLQLADRLRDGVGSVVTVTCCGRVTSRGVLRRIASDALLIQEQGSRECLLSLPCVLSISGVTWQSAAPSGSPVAERIGLRMLLRAISRDRSEVRIALLDASTVSGTIDRVGADFLELATHPAGEARRRSAVRQLIVVPLSGVVAVRRDGA